MKEFIITSVHIEHQLKGSNQRNAFIIYIINICYIIAKELGLLEVVDTYSIFSNVNDLTQTDFFILNSQVVFEAIAIPLAVYIKNEKQKA